MAKTSFGRLTALCVALVAVFASCTDQQAESPQGTGPAATLSPHAQLRAALLDLNDLGKGWTPQDPEPSSLTNDCAGGLERLLLGEDNARAQYARNPERFRYDQISLIAGRYRSGDDASRALGDLRQVLECPAWSEPVKGRESRFRLSSIDGPDLGDESVSYEVRVDIELRQSDPGDTAHAISRTVVIRRRSVISTVSFTWADVDVVPDADDSVIADLARKAERKLSAVGL